MTAAPTPEAGARHGAEHVAPDCRGLNFYAIDGALRALLPLYLPPALGAHLEPHLQRLGELAGGRLDALAETAERHPPVLHPRDRYGRDEPWIEFHPAYHEMERIAFGEFGLHAMGHRGGVLGWPEPLPPVAKYAFQYLFTQAEFGLMCPVSLTDTAAHLLIRHGDAALRERFVPRMLSQERAELLRGSQFMTEKSSGSDVRDLETTARREGDHWRLSGDKWFCSHADADVALLLARPEGAPPGTRGLALFAMPWRLEDGTRNAYRIVRLKEKLGTRSMASGEIVLEGALAYLVGDPRRGLKQILEQVNLSRLSHGARAAGMMRRCLNEALRVARYRRAFGKPLVELPLQRRQLLKLLVPTEQALSVVLHTAHVAGAAGADPAAADALRLLTPLVKLRACRDNLRVATGAMEVRGGNGYIEDWVNARLVRDAHVGVLWEGTSNIVALDAIARAVGRHRAHEPLAEGLYERLSAAEGAPAAWRARVKDTVTRAATFAAQVAQALAERPEAEALARQAAGSFYHAVSAALLTWEGARLGAAGGDARRLLLARLVLEHRLAPRDPLAAGAGAWEAEAGALLLDERPVPLEAAARLLAAE
jgi:alkylation response protein AidB-like acyl-CoA dehydrogenase